MKRVYDARQLPAFLTTQEYADLMRITPQTVCRQCSKGELPCIKVDEKSWRIDKNAVLDRINERSTTT